MTISAESKAHRIAQRILTNNFSQYDPKIHIPLLIDLFEKGKDIASFCVEAEMDRSTFFEWVKKYKDFAKAYAAAEELARIWYEKMGEDNFGQPMFNNGLWALQMRNRFGYTNERKLKIAKLKAAKSFNAQYEVLKNEVSEGNLTSSEADKMVKFVATGCDINQKTEIEPRVAMIEQLMKDKK